MQTTACEADRGPEMYALHRRIMVLLTDLRVAAANGDLAETERKLKEVSPLSRAWREWAVRSVKEAGTENAAARR